MPWGENLCIWICQLWTSSTEADGRVAVAVTAHLALQAGLSAQTQHYWHIFVQLREEAKLPRNSTPIDMHHIEYLLMATYSTMLQHGVEWKDHLLWLAGSALSNVGSSLPQGHISDFSATWCPRGPLCHFLQSYSLTSLSSACQVHGITHPQQQDVFICLWWSSEPLLKILISPFLQTVYIPLHSSESIWCIDHSSWFYTICKLVESVLCPRHLWQC